MQLKDGNNHHIIKVPMKVRVEDI